MYFVTRYDDVTRILQDSDHFVVGTGNSTVFDTFGEHMMTIEGELHDFYKRAHQPFFLPATIRDTLEDQIRAHVDLLIDGFEPQGEVEIRAAFASRLPILTMLSMFGLAPEEEPRLRGWYDSFEKALSNFTWDEEIRTAGRESAAHFIALIQQYLDALRSSVREPDDSTLLGALLRMPEGDRLSDEQICRNALIIFFGGISTVEALILNALYALSLQSETLERVRRDAALIPKAINETIRWLGPVQSATRHVVRETELHGVVFQEGDTVNCMLNVQRQIGFAVGPHHCLGSRLARAEARIALQQLLTRLPDLRLDIGQVEGPQGYEFRQPLSAVATWRRN